MATATVLAHSGASILVGWMGDAWDVAHAIRHLVADEARCVTATERVVDGGRSAVTR